MLLNTTGEEVCERFIKKWPSESRNLPSPAGHRQAQTTPNEARQNCDMVIAGFLTKEDKLAQSSTSESRSTTTKYKDDKLGVEESNIFNTNSSAKTDHVSDDMQMHMLPERKYFSQGAGPSLMTCRHVGS